MRFLLMALMLFVVAAPLRADLGALDPAARPSTLLGARYVLSMSVTVNGTDEEELTGRFPLDLNGRLTLMVGGKAIPPINLSGVTVSEARTRIQAALKGFFVNPPEVLVGIAAMQRMRVLVEGATFRSGTITLPDGSRLSDLMAACGYMASADLNHIRIRRTAADGGRSEMTVDFLTPSSSAPEALRDPLLREGDRVFLPILPAPVAERSVAVVGEVRSPGTFRFTGGMTVRDALSAARGFTTSADAESVVIRRLGDSGILRVNGDRAMKQVPTDDIKLQPDDTVVVGTKDSGRRWAILGEVYAPITQEYRKPITVKQAVMEAGGFKNSADTRQVVLAKRMLFDPARSEAVTLNFDDILSGKAPDVALEPGDVLQVPPRRKVGFNLLDVGSLIMRFLLF